MGSNKYRRAAVGLFAVMLWVALAMFGGPLNRMDTAAIDVLAAERATFPFLTHSAIWISLAGSAPVTIGLSLLGAALLGWRGKVSHAAPLLVIVLGGRLMIELLKQSIGRPRPDLDLHAATIDSLSFPSGHAANSMITFMMVALACIHERHRRAAVTIAIAASLLVGTTRPVLGVHWPSDVLGGWIFGLLWVVGWWHVLSTSSLGVGTAGAVGPLSGQRRRTMAPTPRDPAEQALIEDSESIPTPSQGGGSGGGIALDVGSRDELARATGKDEGVTRVHKSDKPEDGDEPNLPNRS